MVLFYESWKRNFLNPLFYFVSIGAGLAFTAFFTAFNTITAIKVSAILFLSIIFFSLLMAFITKDKQDVIEVAKRIANNGNHNLALKILVKERKRAVNNEYCLKLDLEIGTVYYSMEQYQQAVDILSEILKNDETEWTWKVYFQLAKALSHTRGYFSDEVLDAYLSCVKHRKKFDEYGKGDLKPDICLCHEISEIYRVKKKYTASNMWFRDEMLLQDAYCDIGIKNKIKDLLEKAAELANKNLAEDALRLYEEAAYLIENHISTDCDKYAMVQLEMGQLFWKGYVVPRYDLALGCFQKSIEIKRKYMSDLPKELSDLFAYVLPDMQELCKKSLDIIRELYSEFWKKRGSRSEQDVDDIRSLIDSRNAVIDKCEEVLGLFEEVFPEDSLVLAEIYRLIGEVYKWYPLDHDGCVAAAVYLEKVAKIWRKYKNDKLIQKKLASLLVDLGGTFVMQKDYETGLSYRIEALKIIRNVENVDIADIGYIEVSLKCLYEEIVQSKTVDYNSFLESNGLSTVIESVQVQPLGNGWVNVKVTLLGGEVGFIGTMSMGSR